MFFLLGGVRPPRWSSLTFHLLLWAVLAGGGDGNEGEICGSWLSPAGEPNGAFRCPKEGSDGADAKFCCGTCSAPYCCSSEEPRLNQTLCHDGQLEDWEAGRPSRYLPRWSIIAMGALGIFLSVLLSYATRRARRRCQNRREVQNGALFHFVEDTFLSAMAIIFPSFFALPPALPPPSKNPSPSSVADPCPKDSSPTSNGPPVAQLGCVNAGAQDYEDPPGPSCTSVTEGPSPSQPSVSSSVPSPSDAEEPCVSIRPASLGCGSPRPTDASALDNDDTPPYNNVPEEQAQSAALDNPGSGDAPPRCSGITSPTFPSEGPPPDSVAISHGLEVLPCASDNPAGVRFCAATPGVEGIEMATLWPPGPRDTAAGHSILDAVMDEDELDQVTAL